MFVSILQVYTTFKSINLLEIYGTLLKLAKKQRNNPFLSFTEYKNAQDWMN